MTRAEAIEKVAIAYGQVSNGFAGADFVDALIALDLLKVEQPPSDSARELAHKALREMSILHLPPGGTSLVISALEAAGLKIVKQDSR